MTTSVKISFPEGTSFSQVFTVYDQDSVPIDITSSSIEWAAYTSDEARTGTPTPVYSKTVGDGITIDNQMTTPGQFTIAWDPTDTTDGQGAYQYEINLVLQSGDTYEAARGAFILIARRLGG